MLAYCGRPPSAAFHNPFPYIVHAMRGKRLWKSAGARSLDGGRPRHGDHQSGRLQALANTNHEPLQQRREQQHDAAADGAPPEDLEKQTRQRLEVSRVIFAGELSGEVASEGHAEKPQAQRLADETGW